MDVLEEYVKHELALREAVMRCECQIKQPSLGAEDIKEISDHMHALQAQQEQKSETLKALGKMRNAWMLEVRELKNQHLGSDSTIADAQIADLSRDLAEARRELEEKQRALEEAQRSREAALAQEREQFEEANAATIEHWASIVATVEEERLADQQAFEAAKAQVDDADTRERIEQRMRQAEEALCAERACWAEKEQAWALERQMFVEQTRGLEKHREEKAQMAQTLADEKAQMAQTLADERKQMAQTLADERKQMEQTLTDERQQWAEENRAWERRHVAWDDEKKTWERKHMDEVEKASAKAAAKLAAREDEVRAELKEEMEREFGRRRGEWETSLERQREEWGISLRAAEERATAVEEKRAADNSTREALEVRLRASEESVVAVEEERLVERHALATLEAQVQATEERFAAVEQVLADERQASAAKRDECGRAVANATHELAEEYKRKMHQLEQVLAEERQAFASRRDEWERVESGAAAVDGACAAEWRQKVEELEMTHATERQSFAQEREQWTRDHVALEEQYKGESRQLFALLAKEKQKQASERNEWSAQVAAVEEQLASERAHAETLEAAVHAQADTLPETKDTIQDVALDHTAPTLGWDGRGAQALEQKNTELAQALEQKDAELAAALAQKDAEWQVIIADFQNVLTRERAARDGALAQKDNEWQAIMNDFQALLHDARAEADALQTVVDAQTGNAAATQKELAALRAQVDAARERALMRAEDAEPDSTEGDKRKEKEWARHVKAREEEHAAVLKEKEEAWMGRVNALQEHIDSSKEDWGQQMTELKEGNAQAYKAKEDELSRCVVELQEARAEAYTKKERQWELQLAALQAQVRASEVKEEKLQQHATELQGEYDASREQADALQREVQELHDAVAAHKTMEDEWTQHMEHFGAVRREDIAVKEEKYQSLKDKYSALQEKYQSLENNGSAAEDTYNAATEDKYSTLEEKYQALEDEYIALEEKYSTAEDKYKSLEEKYNAIEEKYNSAEEKYKIATEATEKIRSAHAAAVDLHGSTERQPEQQQHAEDASALAALRSHNNDLAAEVAEQRTKILYLQQQNMAERTKSVATLIEMETLKESTLRSAAEEYEEKLESLEQQCERLSARIIELEQQKNVTVNEANSQWLTKLSRMESELNEAHKSKEAAWREREAALIAQIDDVRRKSEDAAAAETHVVEDLRARARAWQTELEEVKQELAEQKARTHAAEERRAPKQDLGIVRSMSAVAAVGPVSSYIGGEVGDGEDRSVVSMQDLADLRDELQQASMKASQIPDFQRTLAAERLAFKMKKREMEEKIQKVILARKADQQAMMKCNKEWQDRVQVLEEDRTRLANDLHALQSSCTATHSAASSTSGKLAEQAPEQRIPPLAALTQSTGSQHDASPISLQKQPSIASPPAFSKEPGQCSASDSASSSKVGEHNSTGSQSVTKRSDSVGVQEQIDLLRQQRLEQLQKLEMLKRQQVPHVSSAKSAALSVKSVKSAKSAASVGSE